MPDLVRIVYSSRPTPRATVAQVHRIVAGARAFNRSRGITGRLLVVTDAKHEVLAFLQWIEGPPLAIETCMQRIKRDPRHTSIRVGQHCSVKARAYPEWSMHRETIPIDQIDEALREAGIEGIVDTDGTVLLADDRP